MLQLLDGSRNLEQLAAEVRAWHPADHYGEQEGTGNADPAGEAVRKFLIQAGKLALLVS